jgi:hypothetical protein
MDYIEFQYSGGLKLERVSVGKDAIISVQKTISGNYGCIISLSNGEKYPVKESYENVISMLRD